MGYIDRPVYWKKSYFLGSYLVLQMQYNLSFLTVAGICCPPDDLRFFLAFGGWAFSTMVKLLSLVSSLSRLFRLFDEFFSWCAGCGEGGAIIGAAGCSCTISSSFTSTCSSTRVGGEAKGTEFWAGDAARVGFGAAGGGDRAVGSGCLTEGATALFTGDCTA